jgi:nitrite reductase/ring-hydroxylating ferredoxin subunit
MNVTRREFVEITGATVVCACVACALGSTGCAAGRTTSETPSAPQGSYRKDGDRVIVSLSKLDDLEEVGGAVKFTLDQQAESELKIILLRESDDSYRAFADRCTHSGKELNYIHQDRMLQCASGKAQFDLDGNVLKGPAEEPLRIYGLKLEGDDLQIVFGEA